MTLTASTLGNLVFSPVIAPWLIAAFIGAALGLCLRSHRLVGTARGVLALRLTALALAGIALAAPSRLSPRITPDSPNVTLIVDASASMALCDEPREPGATRLDRVRATWLERSFLEALSSHAAVDLRAVAEQTQHVSADDASNIEPAGSRSELWSALRALASGSDGPPAHRDVVLLSDGRDTSGPQPPELAEQLRTAGVRLNVVPLGAPEHRLGTRLLVEPPPGLVEAGEPVSVRVSVRAERYAGLPAVLRIRDTDTRGLVASHNLTLTQDWQSTLLSFVPVFTPDEHRGVLARVYEATLEIPGRATSRDEGAPPEPFLINVTHVRPRVLILEGRPSWRSRTLTQALAGDPRIDLTTVSAVAAPTRAGEPGSIRVTHRVADGTGSALVVSDTIDLSETSLEAYDAIILGSDLAAMLNEDEQTRLARLAPQGRAILLAGDEPAEGPRVARLASARELSDGLLDDSSFSALAEALRAEILTHVFGQPIPPMPEASIAAEHTHAAQGEPVTLTAFLRDSPARDERTTLPDQVDERWTIQVRRDDPAPITTLPLTKADSDIRGERRLRAVFAPEQDGVHRFTLLDSRGTPRADTAVVVRTPDPEHQNPAPDHGALVALANATGGTVIAPEDHASFLEALVARREAAATPPLLTPLIPRELLLCLASALLIAEWSIRRRRGFA